MWFRAVHVAVAAAVAASTASQDHLHHHHDHRHAGHHVAAVHTHSVRNRQVALAKVASGKNASAPAADSKGAIMAKLKSIEEKLAAKAESIGVHKKLGSIKVNGPVPKDFGHRFEKEVAEATGCMKTEVKVVSNVPSAHRGISTVVFEAPDDVVEEVKLQVADPESHLVNSELRHFFVAKGGLQEDKPVEEAAEGGHEEAAKHAEHAEGEHEEGEHKEGEHEEGEHEEGEHEEGEHEEGEHEEGKAVDIDTAMPYGNLEPFGREDTAQELTENSIKESDDMVDQLEKAEVAEEKRSVFRALTRLRGMAISSFDAVARSQTGNVDQYAQSHKWREEHPLHHLADEESDVAKWAFPNPSDF